MGQTTSPPRAVQGMLPFEGGSAEPTAFEALCRRSGYLASVVEACSRRRDVREIRAALLLVILSRSCPAWGRPRLGWYVPGAAARMSPATIAALWRFGAPPSERTIRRHLGELERSLAIVRSPGSWLPSRQIREAGRVHRFPDTIHVLQGPTEAEWWRLVGLPRLDGYPEARRNPTVWRKILGDWRQEAALPLAGAPRRAATLTELATWAEERAGDPEARSGAVATTATSNPRGRGHGPPEAERVRTAEALARALSARLGAFELLLAARAVGIEIRGPNLGRLAARPRGLEAGLASLVIALRSGMRVRSRAGWVVRAALEDDPDPMARSRLVESAVTWARGLPPPT